MCSVTFYCIFNFLCRINRSRLFILSLGGGEEMMSKLYWSFSIRFLSLLVPWQSGEYFLDVWGVFGLWLTYKWTILVGRTFHAGGFFTQTLHWQSLMSFSGRREKDTCKSWKAAERGDILVEARQKLNGHSIQVGSIQYPGGIHPIRSHFVKPSSTAGGECSTNPGN